MPMRSCAVKKGDWRTLEFGWNHPFKALFRGPAGARVKLRYGVGFLGMDGKQITLDGVTPKQISAGAPDALLYVRLQVRVPEDAIVNYVIEMGDPQRTPSIHF